MRKMIMILIAVVLCSVVMGGISTAAAQEQEQVVHIVQSGETLSGIAARYSVSEADIAAANNITNWGYIQFGQRLLIPMVGTGGPAAAETRYTVRYGETLGEIAARFGVDIDALAQANGIADVNRVEYAQLLVIPGKLDKELPLGTGGAEPLPTTTATGGPVAMTYVAAYGETLADVAARFGISEAVLAEANGITAPGQAEYVRLLVIPVAGGGGYTDTTQPYGTGGPDMSPAVTTQAAASVVPAATATTYNVRAGDTLGGIAAQFGTSTTAIAQANGIINPSYIQTGQMLTIPGVYGTGGLRPTAAMAVTYTVRTGDTLRGIAAQFGTSAEAIAQANGISNLSYIQISQVLVIP